MLSPFISYNGSCENLVSNHDTPWYSYSFLCPVLIYVILKISRKSKWESWKSYLIQWAACMKYSFVDGFPHFNPVHSRLLLLWASPFFLSLVALRVILQSSIWKYLILPHHLLLQVIEINISTKHAHYIKWHLLEK